MFIRKLKNRSGSISVQTISKADEKYRVVKTLGSSQTEEGLNLLLHQAEHTLRLLNNKISIVFYDMTTLYFEVSDEGNLRKTGFSKDGKHQNPQIYLGLLIGLGGYAIGYDIFEGHTLIPVIKKLSKKYIIGARIKNEKEQIKKQIIEMGIKGWRI